MVEEGLRGRVHVRMCAVGREQFTLMVSKSRRLKQFSLVQVRRMPGSGKALRAVIVVEHMCQQTRDQHGVVY